MKTKRWVTRFLLSFVLALAACAAPPPETNLANPASVYCREQGNTLEIRTAEDGSQSGVCIFPDGSRCDEWACFRGECGPAAATSTASPEPNDAPTAAPSDGAGGAIPPGTSEAVSDWWGTITANPPGAQFDDVFERQDLGQVILYGIDASDPAVKAQIEELRGSGKIVHLYGWLFSNVPDANGSQIRVERIEVEE